MSDEMMVQNQGNRTGAGVIGGAAVLGTTGYVLRNKAPESWGFLRTNAYKSWDDIVADVSKDDSVIITQAAKEDAAEEVKAAKKLAENTKAAQTAVEEAAGELKGTAELANYENALKAAEGDTPAVEKTLLEVAADSNAKDNPIDNILNKFKEVNKDKEFKIGDNNIKIDELNKKQAIELSEFKEFAQKEEFSKDLETFAKKQDVYKNIRKNNEALNTAREALKTKNGKFNFNAYDKASNKARKLAEKGAEWLEQHTDKLTKVSGKKAAGIAAAAGAVLGGIIGACCKKNSEEIV